MLSVNSVKHGKKRKGGSSSAEGGAGGDSGGKEPVPPSSGFVVGVGHRDKRRASGRDVSGGDVGETDVTDAPLAAVAAAPSPPSTAAAAGAPRRPPNGKQRRREKKRLELLLKAGGGVEGASVGTGAGASVELPLTAPAEPVNAPLGAGVGPGKGAGSSKGIARAALCSNNPAVAALVAGAAAAAASTPALGGAKKKNKRKHKARGSLGAAPSPQTPHAGDGSGAPATAAPTRGPRSSGLPQNQGPSAAPPAAAAAGTKRGKPGKGALATAAALPPPPSGSSFDIGLPFPTDYNDHFETPWRAYSDAAPILDAINAHLHGASAPRSALALYDPYYCAGAARTHLGALGFTTLAHAPRDFYRDVTSHAVPPHDVLITNPPYSDDHKQRCLDFVQQANKGRPFLLLMPAYVASKAYCRARTGLRFLVPHAPYAYTHPEGTGKDQPPFASLWFLGNCDDVPLPSGGGGSGGGGGGGGGVCLVHTVEGLQAVGVVPGGKRANPRQRAAAKAKAAVAAASKSPTTASFRAPAPAPAPAPAKAGHVGVRGARDGMAATPVPKNHMKF